MADGALISVDAKIGLDEIATVQVARVDRDLCAKRDELTKAISDGKRNLASLKKELSAELDSLAKSKFQDKIDALNDAFSELKPTKGMSIKIASTRMQDGDIIVSFSGRGNLHLYGDVEMKLKPTDKITSLSNSIEAENDEITQLGVKLADVMRRRSELPAVERQIKAQIVMNKLGQSEEGRATLRSLDSGEFSKVLGLPLG